MGAAIQSSLYQYDPNKRYSILKPCMITNKSAFLVHNLLGSVYHKGGAQGMDRDIQTGLEGRGCTSCGLLSVQRSSAARRNAPV